MLPNLLLFRRGLLPGRWLFALAAVLFLPNRSAIAQDVRPVTPVATEAPATEKPAKVRKKAKAPKPEPATADAPAPEASPAPEKPEQPEKPAKAPKPPKPEKPAKAPKPPKPAKPAKAPKPPKPEKAPPTAAAPEPEKPVPGKTTTRAYAEEVKHPAPPDLLAAGPMVGYSSMRAVALWVQLTRPGGAQVEYWIKGQPERRWRTAIVETTDGTGNILHLLADSLTPGQRYTYRLWIADADRPRLRVAVRPYPLEFQSQALWQWRNDPPSFKVAIGSCNYVNDREYDRPGEPYGGDYQIFNSIDQQKPDAMLWLGDNVYMREADWDSPLGIARRYAHTRALPALQPLLASVHHYATWDDHDYGPNDSDRSWAYKNETLATFKRFWANPMYGLGSTGVASTFQWADVQFFLLDDRWNRTPNLDDPAHGQMFGPEQLRWLTESLSASTATFKVIASGGQLLNGAKEFENFANYETERTAFLKRLADTRVPGIVLLTGDRHFAELTMLDRPGLYPLYELTTSPLTARTSVSGQTEDNPLRVGGTLATERNFATLDVSGPLKSRKLTLTLCNTDGQPIWKRELRAQDLRIGASPALPPPVALVPPVVAPRPDSSAAPVRKRVPPRRLRRR